jgi:wyosine [tRNA(Phe)-imidazoG37] synthetase (radical SAM superfamily)
MAAGRLPWESDDSDDEVLLLYAVGNKCKRKWVHEVNMKRREFGEFHHLMKQLRQDEVKFKEYFRMSSNQFDQLLSLIKDGIEKEEVNCRESISAEERLALCLRLEKENILYL